MGEPQVSERTLPPKQGSGTGGKIHSPLALCVHICIYSHTKQGGEQLIKSSLSFTEGSNSDKTLAIIINIK